MSGQVLRLVVGARCVDAAPARRVRLLGRRRLLLGRVVHDLVALRAEIV